MGHHRFLTGNLGHFHLGRFQDLGIANGFADTDVEGDLDHPGNLHRAFIAEFLQQRGLDAVFIFFLQSGHDLKPPGQ